MDSLYLVVHGGLSTGMTKYVVNNIIVSYLMMMIFNHQLGSHQITVFDCASDAVGYLQTESRVMLRCDCIALDQ